MPLVPEHSLVVAWTEASRRPLTAGLYNLSRSTPVGGGPAGKNLTAFIARVEASDTHYYFPLVRTLKYNIMSVDQYVRSK